MEDLPKLTLTHIPGSNNWRVAKEFVWSEEITVPKGFVTDLASVPRVFWTLFPRDGQYLEPAVVHDYCYQNLSCSLTRKQADEIFIQGMKAYGVGYFSRTLIYLAVRVFGNGYWQSCRKKLVTLKSA